MSDPHPKDLWNSLEVAKLIATLFTPIMVVIVGYFIQATIQSENEARKQTDRMLDMRANVYRKVQPDLYRIFCFIEEIGPWKVETP